jgi:hypothetical protein
MVRGPPQKYQNRAPCSICIELELKKVAQRMDIDFSRALTHGLQFLIDYRIKTGERIPTDVLEDWQKVKETALNDLKEYLKIEQDRQVFLSDIIETKKKADKKLHEVVDVWCDIEEKYKTIPRKEYNPNFHTIVKRGGKK